MRRLPPLGRRLVAFVVLVGYLVCFTSSDSSASMRSVWSSSAGPSLTAAKAERWIGSATCNYDYGVLRAVVTKPEYARPRASARVDSSGRPRTLGKAPSAAKCAYDTQTPLRLSHVVVATNTVAGHSVEDLVAAGEAADRNGLSAAGRALQKHGARAGSVFPEVTGGPSALNPASRDVLEGILNDPGKTVISRSHPSLGDVIDVRATSGQGVRFTKDGKFIGFLDPGRKP